MSPAAGTTQEYARTVAVNVFVLVETFYLFNCRSLRRSLLSCDFRASPYILAGVAAMVLLQLPLTYAPFMNAAFHTAPIGLADWGKVLLVAAAASVVVEVEKVVQFAKQP